MHTCAYYLKSIFIIIYFYYYACEQYLLHKGCECFKMCTCMYTDVYIECVGSCWNAIFMAQKNAIRESFKSFQLVKFRQKNVCMAGVVVCVGGAYFHLSTHPYETNLARFADSFLHQGPITVP